MTSDIDVRHDYRFYVLDVAGKVLSGTDKSATSDDEAMRVARELFPKEIVEIWCGSRVVGKFEKNVTYRRF